MAKPKNYNILRRGITAALVAAAGAKVLTACADTPESEPLQPSMVQVQIIDGEEMLSARTVMHGCFSEKGESLSFYAPDTVGTLALKDSINGKPITFTFTAAGTHKQKVLDQREVAALKTYTPADGAIYTSPGGQGQSEQILCVQELADKELPAQYDGRFAQVRYDGDDSPQTFYGPYDETSYVDNSCGPVTSVDGVLYTMTEISIPNQAPTPSLSPAPEDCQR